MGNNNLSNSEDIYVKVDQNNLIYIDPNTVINSKGEITDRGLEQEKLVMYVNLEADLVPRSILASDNDSNTLTNIAKGTLNIMGNQNGKDFDTSWTEAYSEVKDNKSTNLSGDFFQSDDSGQSFGIDSISINVKGYNAIPQVQINFVDVRGKTLFDSPENSPYKAFFHIPWPIFYLTVKGFYGKAIKYRLHLVKFSTKFNESNGNFEVSTTFVGSTYAYLSDIPLQGLLNAPYLFPNENSKDVQTDGSGKILQTVVKSTRGYDMLKSIYGEYKQKGLIKKDFPVKTLREILTIAETLDVILEREIFDQVVDMRLFVGIKELEESLKNFETEVKGWAKKRLDPNPSTSYSTNTINYYYLSDKDKLSDEWLIDETKDGTLAKLLNVYAKRSDTYDLKGKIPKNKIFTEKLMNNTSSVFDKYRLSVDNIQDDVKFYIIKDSDGKNLIAIDELINQINEVQKNFDEQRIKLEEEVERRMNEIVRRKDGGFGFEPTIRNIFAVILSNAEVLIRLMKDVHKRAFDQAETRKKIIGTNFSKETNGDSIYPWPEIKGTVKSKENVIIYPGDQNYVGKLKSNDARIWPEVDFIENYIGVTTNKVDPLTNKEGGFDKITYSFETNADSNITRPIDVVKTVIDITPYQDKNQANFLYEIWERALNFTMLDSFDSDTIKELSKIEFDNIKDSIVNDSNIINLLKDNVKSQNDLVTQMKKLAPFDNVTYYQDQIPTTFYLNEFYNTQFKLEGYTTSTKSLVDDRLYTKLNGNLLNYVPDGHRENIFPFNSPTYISYLKDSNGKNLTSFSKKELLTDGFLEVNTKEGLISGQIDPKFWVRYSDRSTEYTTNIFSRGYLVNNNSTNILNTPYFHNQLFYDFTTNESLDSKYVGSAYLLLNSLPFVELDEHVDYKMKSGKKVSPLVSTLFREISSSQYVPYHLILKWGSIYHRYKRSIRDDFDILEGCLNSTYKTTNIDGRVFFDNEIDGVPPVFLDGEPITYDLAKDVGIHPYYDSIFHQIVNGYNHYVISDGDMTSFNDNVDNGKIVVRKRTVGGNDLNYWTSYVNNSKYETTDTRFTLLPCDGGNEYIDLNNTSELTIGNDTFDRGQQIYYRTIWEDEYINSDFNDVRFSSPLEYNNSVDDVFGADLNNKKVYDLIGTFSPSILEEFERLFLKFASGKINTTVNNDAFDSINYQTFQDLLKEIVSIEIPKGLSTNVDDNIRLIRTKQVEKLKSITNNILSTNNLVKLTIANPKEIDPHIFNGFAEVSIRNSYSVNGYSNTQNTSDNRNLIKLYIGEEPTTDCYLNFFIDNDIELKAENIITFRPLVLMYAGYVQAGNPPTHGNFKDYIRNNVFVNSEKRRNLFLDLLIPGFSTFNVQTEVNDVRFNGGYNDQPMKVELYNFFKSMNDKWISGNSIGQRSLLEEFLFLDKANRDIGDIYFFNVSRLAALGNEKNVKQSLFGAISMLLQETGFDMKALPSYVNYYGTNFSNTPKMVPSKNVAKNIFGTFLDVDYQESSPKVIIQYVSASSKRIDIGNKKDKKYKFSDDSFNIGNVNNNPVMYELPKVFSTGDLSKSNKVVAFEVSFGDQNQNIFKGIQLDQATIKNTSESFVVLENLARSESGSGTYNVDIGLYEYYRQAAYSCEVTCMGNVMIQPTMFFYLKNIPMFKGSYWITEVSHNIRNNNITTTFKGSRLPYTSLPDLSDSFMSSYKTLFDKLIKKAQNRVNGADRKTDTSEQLRVLSDVTINGKTQQTPTTITVDRGLVPDDNEKIVTESGITEYGIPFNGFMDERFIQKITHPNHPSTIPNKNGENDSTTWLRTRVVRMGELNNVMNLNNEMSVIGRITSASHGTTGKPLPSVLTWQEVSQQTKNQYFYSTKFKLDRVNADKVVTATSILYNPKNRKKIELNPKYRLDFTVLNGEPRVYQGPIDVFPQMETYAMGMSIKLMKDLGLNDGDVVYFNLI